MTGASLKYLTKEGFRNVWTNRMMSLASICVLMSCLVLVGSATMIFLNIDSLLARIEEENVVMVYLDDNATEAEVAAMEDTIRAIDNIKDVEFVSKVTAWEEQLSTMGEAEREFFTDVSTEIPLPDAYKVTVDNLDNFGGTVEDLKELDHVDIIRENRDLAQRLVAIRHGISVIAIVIIAVLFLISLFIISNTIRLTVYSRRLEISIMKSVGATNSFVRFPFVIEGMILGILSGTIGFGLVWGIYELAITQFSDLLASINLTAITFTDYALMMLGAFILIGVICGVGGSLVTMSKYLNREGSEISNV
ncbi:MAG: permease-like cell division protein FtsX [Eubacterium sp.]|nr:permease-like cell division protein FtsX [Eubacterium sp.]